MGGTTFSTTTPSIATLSITTMYIATLSIIGSLVTLSLNDIQQTSIECHYASAIMLSVRII